MADMNGKLILEDTDWTVVSSTKKRMRDHEGDSFKLFVRGLYNGTTETKLREYFSQYGDIKNIFLCDGSGLAFISFTEAQAKNKIFEVDHFLDGRKIFPKCQRPQKDEPSLFVGRLPKDTTVSIVEEYFSTYGEIEHIDARSIKNGNCIIVFTEAQTIDKVVEAGDHFMDETNIIIKRKGFTGSELLVGGLHGNTTQSKLRDYFSVYGKILSINLKKIKSGIGFVMFTNAQSLDKILEGEHFLDGNKLITKRNGEIISHAERSHLLRGGESDQDVTGSIGNLGQTQKDSKNIYANYINYWTKKAVKQDNVDKQIKHQ